jgi:hypothetical protein
MLTRFALPCFAVLALILNSCSSGERDGRKYANNNPSPVAGKMGVSYRRVKADNAPERDPNQAPKTVESDGLIGALTGDHSDEPPGLLDRNVTPDEPGAKYWMHAQQSPNPMVGKMGVQVTRRKK